MDNIELIKTMQRMAKSKGANSYFAFVSTTPESLVKTVERWNEKHFIKTRLSEFPKLFPNASLGRDDILTICPITIDSTVKCNTDSCFDCKRNYWMHEVK